MDLYIIRHAEAIPLGENNITEDEARPLTARGHTQCKVVSEGLQRRGIHLDYLITSPLVRARQTADGIIQAWVGAVPHLQECDYLAPGGKRRKLARFLNDLKAESVGVVGHQPDLGELIGWLIGSRRASFDLAKAGVALVTSKNEVEKGGSSLDWMVTPEWFEQPS